MTEPSQFHLFDAAAGLAPRGRLRTSLQRTGPPAGHREESARQAVLLVEDDCVLATVDVTAVREHQVFELVQD